MWVVLALAACEKMDGRGKRGGDLPTTRQAPPVSDDSEPIPKVEVLSAGPAVVARDQGFPSDVTVDDRFVYWSTGDSHIARAPKAGGPAQDLASDFAITIVVAGDSLFYSTDRSIRRIAKDGRGDKQVLATLSEDPLELEIDATHIYFNMFDGSMIGRVPRAGGSAEKLIGSEKHSTLAIDDQFLYIASYKNGTIRKLDKKTLALTTLAKGQKRPLGMASFGPHVFWANETDGTIMRLDKAGGTPVTLVSGQVNQEQMAFAGDQLYWGSWSDGPGKHKLMRMPIAGGTAQVVSGAMNSPSGMATDSLSVYVANKGAGTIEKFPLK